MKTTRRDNNFGLGDEVERDEHGHRLIDCVACNRKPHMHPKGQQREQIRLTKLYSQIMIAAISLGMDEGDIRQLQMLLQPYLQTVPRLLNTADISFLFEEESDSVNSSQAAA